MSFAPLVPVQFSVDQVAVALSHSPLGGGHLGLAFYDKDKVPHLLHLAWHTDLRLDKIPDDIRSCWIATILDLPPAASRAVVAFVRSIAKRRPLIKYGINVIAAKDSFAKQSYKPPKGSDGLTCASFVYALLRGARINLVKIETWEESEKNREWGRTVCDSLEKTDPDHAALVRKNINGLRLRPYELAGAAGLKPKELPLDFKSAQPLADSAEAVLNQHCPVTN